MKIKDLEIGQDFEFEGNIWTRTRESKAERDSGQGYMYALPFNPTLLEQEVDVVGPPAIIEEDGLPAIVDEPVEDDIDPQHNVPIVRGGFVGGGSFGPNEDNE